MSRKQTEEEQFRSSQALERGADEAEEIVEKESAQDQKGDDNDDTGDRMSGSEPGKPDGEEVFAEAESPVAEGFGNGVDGGASGSFGAVRGERNSAGQKRGGPAPVR